VVGTINLVEKIAQLARIPINEVKKLEEREFDEFRSRGMKDALGRWDGDSANAFDFGAKGKASGEKQIIKEGLSEYFIYTIEGTETIANGWSKRMRSMEAAAAPFKIQYRYRPQEYGEQLVRMYLLTNKKEDKLGTTPLPDGVLRVFRDNGRDGLSFLTQQSIKYVPIGDKIELNLGPDRNVIFDLIKLRASRDEIWMHVNGVDVYRRVGQPGVQVEVNSTVAGWDDHELFTQRVRNYTAKPIEVEVRRAFPGHIVFRSQLKPTLHDYQTVQFTATVDAGKKSDLLFEILRHEGHNAKQNNVTLEEAEVKP